MTPERRTPKPGPEKRFQSDVERQEARKMRARRRSSQSVWFGLGVIGVIGWSVVIPTLVGVALGIWLDSRGSGGGISWTLTLMFVGLALGCLNAWHWIRNERRKIEEEDKEREIEEEGKEGDSDREGGGEDESD